MVGPGWRPPDEPGLDRSRPLRRAVALHPRLALRRAEAWLRDHGRRRGAVGRAPRPGHAVWWACATREWWPDRSARPRRAAAALSPDRTGSDDPQGAARRPCRLREGRSRMTAGSIGMSRLVALYPREWRDRYEDE